MKNILNRQKGLNYKGCRGWKWNKPISNDTRNSTHSWWVVVTERKCEPLCLHRKLFNSNCIILLLYVCDMLIVDRDVGNINILKKKDWGSEGSINKYWIWRLIVTIEQDVMTVTRKTHWRGCSKVQCENFYLLRRRKKRWHQPSCSKVWSLIYTMVRTGPDIAHTMGVMSRYLANLEKELWMWFSGSLGTWKVCLSCVCVMEVLNLCWRETEMQTWLVTLKAGSLVQDIN